MAWPSRPWKVQHRRDGEKPARVTNVYSPTHALSLRRVSDKEVQVAFDKDQGLLDRDFQLFYSTGKDDVGLTALTHRPVSAANGYFTLLISPNMSLATSRRATCLRAGHLGQHARHQDGAGPQGAEVCLSNLTSRDRFGLIGFATTVNPYEENCCPPARTTQACPLVDDWSHRRDAINDAWKQP